MRRISCRFHAISLANLRKDEEKVDAHGEPRFAGLSRRKRTGRPQLVDIPLLAFLRLQRRFFDDGGHPVPFRLRDKRNTQDDPFDEFLASTVFSRWSGVDCVKAPGPLITPDMVLHKSNTQISRADDLTQIVGIEVKKVERSGSGRVARASGIDFNTTPPCGKIRVFDMNTAPCDIRGFYLFVCIEPASQAEGFVVVSALALVDGNALNEDFELYLNVTGERTKKIELGTYSDGIDRARPMLIFGNPLGIPELDHTATLIHADDTLAEQSDDLKKVFILKRSTSEDEVRKFCCYRYAQNAQSGPIRVLEDPFLTPVRDTRTRPRGRFTLPFEL